MADNMLITGGTGLLGSELACHFSTSFDIYRVGSADCDIRDYSQVKAFFDETKPKVVLHAAAIADVDFCEKNKDVGSAVNIEGTENIARACKETNAMMIYYSTDYVFNGGKGSAYTEDDKPEPLNYYGYSKYEGEKRVASILDNYAILRVAWLYANHKKAFINKLIDKGRQQVELKKSGEIVEPEKIVVDQIGSPTFALDVARQTEIVLQNNLNGLFHCVSEGETSRYLLAQFIFKELSMPVDILPCYIDEFNWRANRPKNSALDNTKLKKAGLCIMPDYRQAIIGYLKEFVEK